jgi:hypothetical protein
MVMLKPWIIDETEHDLHDFHRTSLFPSCEWRPENILIKPRQGASPSALQVLLRSDNISRSEASGPDKL